jgi:hypothetical protein
VALAPFSTPDYFPQNKPARALVAALLFSFEPSDGLAFTRRAAVSFEQSFHKKIFS